MNENLFIVIAFLVGIFVLWIYGGGAFRDPGGAFIKAPSPLNTGETYGDFLDLKSLVPRIEFSERQTDTNDTEGKKIVAELRKIELELDNEKRDGLESKYKDLVRLERGAAYLSNPDEEYLIIRISDSMKGRVPITGWTLKSPITGRSISIPKASRTPKSGEANTEYTIHANAGDRIYVNTGRSPIGVSFAVNKCSGYMEQFQDFSPSINRSCPDAEEELDFKLPGITLEDACLDFVERIPRCEIVTRSLGYEVSPECQEFISSEINYNACVENHSADPDFYKSEWRIFLKRSNEMWKERREVIKLFDEEGKLVDAITY